MENHSNTTSNTIDLRVFSDSFADAVEELQTHCVTNDGERFMEALKLINGEVARHYYQVETVNVLEPKEPA